MTNKKGKVQIVGDNIKELNDNKLKKSLIVAGAAILLSGIGLYGWNQYEKQSILDQTEMKAYEKAKKAYEEAGIADYKKEDFKKQKEQEDIAKIGEEGKVETTSKEAEPELKEDDGKVDIGSGVKIDPLNYDPDQVSQEIDDSGSGIDDQSNSNIKLINYSEPGANITPEKVAAAILRDVKLYNNSIANNVGWPESEYDPTYYGVAQKYIQAIIEYARSGKEPEYNVYPISYEEQVAQIRYSIFQETQLEIYADNQGYYQILNKFLKTRPNFNSIQSIYVEYQNIEMDGVASKIKAIVIANGQSYIAHLSIDPNQEDSLKLLDIGGN